MKTRTLTAPSIHAALAEARQLFGDDVVLLESVPPEGDQPARITVMADEVTLRRPAVPTAASAASPAAAPARRTAQPMTAEEPARVGFGYGSAPQRRQPAMAVAGGVDLLPSRPEPPTFAQGDGWQGGAPAPSGAAPIHSNLGAFLDQQRGGSAGRGRLFQPPAQRQQAVVPVAHEPARPAALDAIEQLFEDRMQTLHDRLDRMDHRFGSALVGASQRWTAHPLFTLLLNQGLEPATLTRLFDKLAASGLYADGDADELRWALAQELRRMLDATSPRTISGTQLFIGPSGAGKTSLILKLALHQGFFGRHRTTVICLLPEDEQAATFHNPVDVYHRFGIPVQSVRTADDMAAALKRVRGFDQVLIDTPPVPATEAAARKALVRLQRLLGPVVPLTVQWVLDATRALDRETVSWTRRLPLAPDAIALTHLDETTAWGRVAEWLMAFEKPVLFASNKPGIPDGALAYSPTWFVESMLNL